MRIDRRLLRSSTFQLIALYLFVFLVSVGGLLGYVYWSTALLLERQTDEAISSEMLSLKEQHQAKGMADVIATIQRRSADTVEAIYLLTGPNGKPIAGNLAAPPLTEQEDVLEKSGRDVWVEFSLVVNRNGVLRPHAIKALHASFGGEYKIFVGRDIESRREFADIIRDTLFYALLIASGLGLGGGLMMSRNFLGRVEAITDASRAIMEGDMAGRMPVSGVDDELDRLAVALNGMLDQIERLMSGMKDVSTNVAHDLRTPLTRIRARVEAALRSGQPAEQREALESTLEDADRLLQVFNALLSITRVESGQARAGLVPLDAHAILFDVAELYGPMVEEQNGVVRIDAEGELPVRADRQLLSQAISNLFDNALKYGSKPGSALDIVASGKLIDGKVIIAIGDRGAGIPKADRARAVERFVRLDASRSQPGNGLGLSLVASVMRLHGGELVLEDNRPGLLAKLVLPRYVQA